MKTEGEAELCLEQHLAPNRTETDFTKRLRLFGGWILLSSLLFAKPLIALFWLSYTSGEVSYLVLIPFIGAWIVFVDRHRLFRNLSYDPALAGALFACAVGVGVAANFVSSGSFRLSSFILAVVLLWASGFMLLFGKAAARAACARPNCGPRR